MRHLILCLQVGKEGALGRVPEFVDDGVLAMSRSPGAKGAADTMVEQVDVTHFFHAAVGDEFIVDLQHVDGGGDVEKIGVVDGKLVLLVVDGKLKVQKALFQEVF